MGSLAVQMEFHLKPAEQHGMFLKIPDLKVMPVLEFLSVGRIY